MAGRWLGLSMVGVVTAGLLVAAVPGMAAPPVGGGTAGGSTVLLPTGDQVRQAKVAGKTVGSVIPAASHGIGRALMAVRFGNHSYEVPAAAVPYLGHGLDLNLFDVDALKSAEKAGKLPMQVTGQVPAELAKTGADKGKLTGPAATKFGAALTRQFLADRASGHFGGTGLFAGGAGYALAGAAPAVRAKPRNDLNAVTLTVAGASDPKYDGSPVLIMNVDDFTIFGDPDGFTYLSGGTAKVSAPAGHYFAIVVLVPTDGTGSVQETRVLSRPEFTVAGDTTVPIAASEAQRVTYSTPRPSVPQEGGFVVERTDPQQYGIYADISSEAGVPLLVAPASTAPGTGMLWTYPYQRLSSPAGTNGTPYEYNLQYPSTGTIPVPHYVAQPKNLATVDASYYSDVDATGLMWRLGFYPLDGFPQRFARLFPQPTRQTEYYETSGGVSWFSQLSKYSYEIDGYRFWQAQMTADFRRYPAGGRLQQDWNKYPLRSGDYVNFDGATGLFPSFATVYRLPDDTLSWGFLELSDSTVGHVGMGAYEANPSVRFSDTYRVDLNGKTVSEGDGTVGLPAVALGADPATVHVVRDASRQGAMYVLSANTHTEWTWRTQRQPGATMPAGYLCVDGFGKDCAVEPVMNVRTTVAGMSLRGTVPVGVQVVDIEAGHIQLGAPSAVTGATADFSVDGGKSWRHAAVVPVGGGRFKAIFAVTSGAYVSLRVSARDAAGGDISATSISAYQVVRR